MPKKPTPKEASTKQRAERAARVNTQPKKKISVASMPRRKRSEDLRARAAWFQSSAGDRKKT